MTYEIWAEYGAKKQKSWRAEHKIDPFSPLCAAKKRRQLCPDSQVLAIKGLRCSLKLCPRSAQIVFWGLFLGFRACIQAQIVGRVMLCPNCGTKWGFVRSHDRMRQMTHTAKEPNYVQ